MVGRSGKCNTRDAHRRSGGPTPHCMIHGNRHFSEGCKLLNNLENKWSIRQPKKEQNSENIVNQEVNSMSQKAVDGVLKYNKSRKLTFKSDTSHFHDNLNYEYQEEPKLYEIYILNIA